MNFTKRPKLQIQKDVSDFRDYVLDDKNGNQVYEGDVVVWLQSTNGVLNSDIKPKTCVIEWSEVMLGWQCRDLDKGKHHGIYTLSSCHIQLLDTVEAIYSDNSIPIEGDFVVEVETQKVGKLTSLSFDKLSRVSFGDNDCLYIKPKDIKKFKKL